jgi:hypothetical protein
VKSRPEVRLFDYADGRAGHFCIGRPSASADGFWEFYNRGRWASCGEVFVDREMADVMLAILRREALFVGEVP